MATRRYGLSRGETQFQVLEGATCASTLTTPRPCSFASRDGRVPRCASGTQRVLRFRPGVQAGGWICD
jgi:hypothetical protein